MGSPRGRRPARARAAQFARRCRVRACRPDRRARRHGRGGAHRGFYRPHGGFRAWQPSDDPREILDEALVWAAKSDRVEAIERLVEFGADPNADPYRGTPLTWAASNGRVAAMRRLVELGADVNARGTFGGPDHGQGVTALHLAAQSGRAEAVDTLLELGADPTIRDAFHGGTTAGWAQHGAHPELAKRLTWVVRRSG